MKNLFNESRQRFSIRKFAVGVASVAIATVFFGVSTAQAEQITEVSSQPSASLVTTPTDPVALEPAQTLISVGETSQATAEVASSISTTNQASHSLESPVTSQEVTLAENVTVAGGSDDVKPDATVASYKVVDQDLSHSAPASDISGLDDMHTGLERESLNKELAREGVTVSQTGSDFRSEGASAATQVSKTGTEIIVKNPNVEVSFPEGTGKYSSNKVIYHNIAFPDDMAINDGNHVVFSLPEDLRFRTSYSVDVFNPHNDIVGQAVVDPRTNLITTTFNNYFETHPYHKSMNLELDTLFSSDVEEGKPLHLDFDGRIVTVTVGRSAQIPGDEVISKWGSQNMDDPTVMNWAVRLNYARRVLNNLKIVDNWSNNQEFVDGSLIIHYVDNVEPWVDAGSAMDLIQSFSHSDTNFELNLSRLDRMIYIWYQTKLTKPVAESTNPTNHIDVFADDVNKGYNVTARLVGGRGDVVGDGVAHFDLELQKVFQGRPLKDKEFTFRLTDVTDHDNPHDLGEVTNTADGKIIFPNLEIDQPGLYHYVVKEVPGSEAEVVYDQKEYHITINVSLETVDNESTLVAKVDYPVGNTISNKLVTPAKAQIQFSKELTKSGLPQDLTAGTYQFVLKDASGNVIETVSNAADGSIRFSELTFDKVGNYRYTVQEVPGQDEDLIYDPMIAEVTITVNRNGDALVSTVVNPQDTIFNNMVKEQELAKAKFNFTKVLAGRDLAAGEFTFVLKDATGKVLQRVSNDKDGNVAFAELSYDQVGSYTYTIEEEVGSDPSITYDKMVASVRVDVTKEVGGQKNTLVSVTTLPTDTEFNNLYTPPKPAKHGISFTKALAGRDLRAGEFTFVLKDADGNELERVTNSADGKVAFKEISYDKVGTYTYTVSEVKGTDEDVIYDQMVAKVLVTISKDGNTFVATVENPVDTEFNNRVKETKPASTRFELTKVLAGRELKAGEFIFVLKDEGGHILQTVSNDAKGRISFDALTYDKTGVYRYTVEEVKGGDTQVTYDPMVARIQVTVTKAIGETENLLVATLVMPVDSEFNNVYRPPMTPPTPPTPPAPSVPPKPGQPTPPTPPRPVASVQRKSGQLPQTGDVEEVGLMGLGLVAELTAGLSLAYLAKRKKED